MSGGGGGGSTTTTNVLYSPEEAQRRAQLMDTAATLFGSQPTTAPPYPGAVPVGPSGATTQAQNLATNISGTQAGTVPLQAGALRYGLSDIINGPDPTLDNAIKAAVRPIEQAYTGPGGYFAQNRADMIGSNMLGSSRDALANAVIGENYTRGIGDTAAKLAAASRGDTLATFGKTLGVAPGVTAGLTAPADTLGTVGAQQEGYAQQQQDYEAAAREWELNYPWMNLQNYANIIYGGSNAGTQTNATMNAASPNAALTTAGGAAAGWMIGASNGGTYGPQGAAVGALLGYLMSR